MPFTDRKKYTFWSYKFERARLAQGILIYGVGVALLTLGLSSGEARLVIPILVVLGLTYLVLVAHYWRARRSLGQAVILALLHLLAAPASMIG